MYDKYPKRIKMEENKNFWYNKDLFDEVPQHFIRAFLHKDYNIGMHAHEFWEINLITRGSGKQYIEKNSLSITQGDLFVLPPNVYHGYLSEGTLDAYHILINHKFLEQYEKELTAMPGFQSLFNTEPYFRQLSDESFFLHLNNTEMQIAKEELEHIELAETNALYVYQNVLTLKFLCDLSLKMNLYSQKTVHAITSQNDAVFFTLMEHIQAHLNEKITVDALANHLNMSNATFYRRFKKVFGMAPMEFILTCRISKAKNMLKKGEYSRTDIAMACGFFDLSHMNKCLAKHHNYLSSF